MTAFNRKHSHQQMGALPPANGSTPICRPTARKKLYDTCPVCEHHPSPTETLAPTEKLSPYLSTIATREDCGFRQGPFCKISLQGLEDQFMPCPFLASVSPSYHLYQVFWFPPLPSLSTHLNVTMQQQNAVLFRSILGGGISF